MAFETDTILIIKYYFLVLRLLSHPAGVSARVLYNVLIMQWRWVVVDCVSGSVIKLKLTLLFLLTSKSVPPRTLPFVPSLCDKNMWMWTNKVRMLLLCKPSLVIINRQKNSLKIYILFFFLSSNLLKICWTKFNLSCLFYLWLNWFGEFCILKKMQLF